ncbi:hypothetical protein A3K73_05450 [Candidatus Pacearchaeota archaeon RBG_13_36_9]|nr:MAG: hypothetical protein A3K73_05450 [Candidatus Pacearchaeota archaeon RBG_13_36_9]
MVDVVKFSGEKEKFNPNKILKTLKRAGASREQSRRILKDVESSLKDGITTKEILDRVFSGLRETPGIAAKYDLKRALMALGPGGYTFEKYFAEVLKHYGYEVKINQLIKGKRIMQEVDVVAKKDSTYMVECKYYNYPGNYASTKEAMYTYARFLDTNSRMHNFDFPWLATNTKCSWSAIEYSKGVGLKITSWKYPAKESLQRLVEAKKLYPVTVLKTASKFVKQRLLDSGIIMINTLMEMDISELRRKANLSESELKKAILEARQISV